MPRLSQMRTVPSLARLLARFSAQSLRLKITLLTCVVTFLVALTMFWVSYRQTVAVSLAAANERLLWETQAIANPIRAGFEQLVSDARLVRSSSIPEGYFRAERGGGVDPVSGNDLAHWRARFELAFRALMQQRPDYLRMRYIAAAGGRELARVDRPPGAVLGAAEPDRGRERLVTTAPERLLRGLETPDLARALALDPSGILVVPERGRAGPGRVVRVLVSAQFEGATVGVVEITLDYAALLQAVVRSVRPAAAVLVIDPAGEAISHDPGSGLFMPLGRAQMAPMLAQIAQADPGGAAPNVALADAVTVARYQRVVLDTQEPPFALGVVARHPRVEVFAALGALRTKLIGIGAVLILGSVGVAFLAATWITEALPRMTAQLREAARSGGPPVHLPIERRDEIGDLARSFEALRRRIVSSEARAQEVIETVVDGIITIDERGIICDYNPACERLFGYGREEVVGRDVGMLMPEGDGSAHQAYLTRLSRGPGEGPDDTRVVGRTVGRGRDLVARRKDGSTFILELSVSHTHYGNQRFFTGILRDITARKEMEVMKNEFVSTVNHELRTPLTTIRGALGLLKTTSAHLLDAKSARLLDLSYDSCGRLAHLVDDILDMEKIEAGKMDYRLERQEINTLVREIVERHTSYADQYDVRFTVLCAPEPLHCRVDPSRFNQALVNLLSNAAKFSPRGGEVIFAIGREGESVTIRVTDQGPGIPREFRDKIFGKFAQADASSTRARGGSGLGLNIARAIILAFEGEITFTTRLGQGTTFCIRLPRDVELPLQRSA